MNLDILVAQLVRKGLTESKAKAYAAELKNLSSVYGVDASSLVDQLTDDFELNDIGSFLINNALRQGFKTGKMVNNKINKYVNRAIIK